MVVRLDRRLSILDELRPVQVQRISRARPPSGPLSLVTPLLTRQVKSAVAANLDVLKQILERDHT